MFCNKDWDSVWNSENYTIADKHVFLKQDEECPKNNGVSEPPSPVFHTSRSLFRSYNVQMLTVYRYELGSKVPVYESTMYIKYVTLGKFSHKIKCKYVYMLTVPGK